MWIMARVGNYGFLMKTLKANVTSLYPYIVKLVEKVLRSYFTVLFYALGSQLMSDIVFVNFFKHGVTASHVLRDASEIMNSMRASGDSLVSVAF